MHIKTADSKFGVCRQNKVISMVTVTSARNSRPLSESAPASVCFLR